MLAACGGGSGGGGNNADAGPGGPECTGNDDCVSPQVCQPVSQTCEDPGAACASQSECTNGTYCEASAGFCLPSSVGTPCDGPENCDGTCLDGVCGCAAVNNARQLEGSPLDIFFMLDRTGSMGTDCAYVAGNSPPTNSKACYATYALADYVTEVSASADIRLALDDMSHANDCTGAEHDDPEVPMTQLPVAANSALVQDISNENFSGGYGTQIEGALRGIASFTSNPSNLTAGREMIGVLLTDGDANGCDENTTNLAKILSDHRTATGRRTFIIGMTGATESTLETLAIAGGADPHMDFCGSLTPPCHFFSVGNGDGDVIAQALQAIAQQATEIPCEIDVTNLSVPDGEVLDYSKVNVTFTDGSDVTTIGQVADAGSCPTDAAAWYYDNPSLPTSIQLCEAACTAVGNAGDGANLNVVAGCTGTFVIE